LKQRPSCDLDEKESTHAESDQDVARRNDGIADGADLRLYEVNSSTAHFITEQKGKMGSGKS
jgi:hypothetical protein